MGNPAVDFSDPETAEQVENGVQTGFETTNAVVFLEKLAASWREAARLDALLLRALCQLSARPDHTPQDGFTAWDIAEAISEVRGSTWSDPGNKDQMAADVRRLWSRLQDLWESKAEGIEQRLADAGIALLPRLAKTEGGGTGRPTRYRIEWPARSSDSGDQSIPIPNPQPLQPAEVRYVCEDIEEAGVLARIFTRGYDLVGWRRTLFLAVLAVPLLFCTLMLVQVGASLAAILTLGGKSLITSLIAFAAVGGVTWATTGPFFNLSSRRLVLAPWWMQSGDDDRLLELRIPPRYPTKVIKAVRYTTSCPICGAHVSAKSGGLEFRPRIVGRCEESPIEHVFSFDHITRRGTPLRAHD